MFGDCLFRWTDEGEHEHECVLGDAHAFYDPPEPHRCACGQTMETGHE
jgi:hypothetical protein